LIYLSLLGMAVAIACVWLFAPLATSDKAGITTAISMVALAILTSIYAWHTRKMAYAMSEQTKTLRETVSISIRPSVSIDITGIGADNRYPFEPPNVLLFNLQNKGNGAARNLVVTCKGQGEKVEYSKIELPSLNVGDIKAFAIQRTTNVLAEKIKVAYVILEVIYNDDLGEAWHLTLEIDKSIETSKGIKPWKAGETICERLFRENNN
jgi:hypothetical protein